MPKRTRPYRARLLERLMRAEDAANYLNAAMEDSRETFLTALKDVAQAHQMARVAKESGLQRETLYRSFSNEGNPTLDTLLSVLSVFKIKTFFAAEDAEFAAPPSVVPQARVGVARRAKRIHRLTELRNAGQLEFAFPIPNAGSGAGTIGTFDRVRVANIAIIPSSITTAQYGLGQSFAHLSRELSGFSELAALIPPPSSTTVQYAVRP